MLQQGCTEARTSVRLVHNDVFHNGKWLKAKHDIGAQRNERSPFNQTIAFTYEKRGVWIFRNLRDAFGQYVNRWIFDELGVELGDAMAVTGSCASYMVHCVGMELFDVWVLGHR